MKGDDPMNMVTAPAPRVRLLQVADWMEHEASNAHRTSASDLRDMASEVRAIAAEIRAAGAVKTADLVKSADAAEVILAVQDTETLRDLLMVWAGSAHTRPGLTDHDRMRVLESAFTRLLRIEAAHEGDGR